MVPAVGVAESHPVEDGAEPGLLHDLGDLEDLFAFDPGNLGGDLVAPDGGAERVEEVVVVPLLHLQVDIRHLGGVGVPRIDDDDLAALVALPCEEAAGEDRVAGHVPRVGVCRVCAPVDDDIRPVLRLAEGAARVAVVEYRKERGSVADRRTVVEDGARSLSNLGRGGHALTVGRPEPVDQGLLRVVEDFRCVIDRLVVGDILIGAVRLAEAG